MKKIILSLLVLTCVSTINAQTRTLKKVIELVMPGDRGSNGASVVYHPIQKKYYSVIAGNAEYPIAAFDLKGKLLTNEEIQVGFDTRGIWYNSKTKTIQANGYNDFGWTNFKLDAKGTPTGNDVFISGLNQPDPQSVGIFNDKLQKVYFLKDLILSEYNLKGEEKGSTILTPKNEDALDDDELIENYNNTPIYTGILKGEIGLLNITTQSIELYNVISGKPTTTWALPSDAPTNTMFNFAYTNGIVWLFDKDARTWYGYR